MLGTKFRFYKHIFVIFIIVILVFFFFCKSNSTKTRSCSVKLAIKVTSFFFDKYYFLQLDNKISLARGRGWGGVGVKGTSSCYDCVMTVLCTLSECISLNQNHYIENRPFRDDTMEEFDWKGEGTLLKQPCRSSAYSSALVHSLLHNVLPLPISS